MAETDIAIRVVLDDDGAVRGVRLLGQEIQDLARPMEKAEQAGFSFARGMEHAFGGLVSGAIAELSTRLTQLPGQFLDLVSRGADIADVSSAFERLTQEAGGVAETFKTQLRTATAGTISDFELLKEANENLRAGIKPDEMIQLTEAARVLADETGQDLTQSLNELTQAFITGRPQILQNRLGVIDLKQAQEDLAKQLGTTTDKLSKEGEVYAARQAILDATTEKLEATGRASIDAADNIAQISTTLQNARDRFAEAAANNETLNVALSNLSKFINEIPFDKLITGLTQAGNAAVTSLVQIGDFIGNGLAELQKAAARGATGELDKALEHVVDLLAKDTPKATQAAITQFKFLQKEILSNKNVTLAYADDLLTIDGQIKASAKNFGILIEANKDLGTAIEKVSDTTKNDPLGTLPSGLVSTGDAAKSHTTPAIKDLNDKIKDLRDNGYQTTFSQKELKDSIKELGDEAEKSAEQVSSAAQSIISSFGSAISSIMNGGDIEDALKGLGSSLGAVGGGSIGSIFGPLGESIGAEIGAIAGDAIVKGLFDVFGNKDNAGTKFRKAADKFFADVFDGNRLSIVINDQLKRIDDLEFGGTEFGDATKGFFDALNALPDTARAAFGGVATAFSQILGDVSLDANLAAVFANNLGSLNNLQLLIQSTGKSAEDLQGAIVDAFLNGEISALKAQTAINGINQAMQEGIPDAVGAVSQAFDNLKAAGEKGGRASTDALRDIGAEAKELGEKTFDEIINNLIATGQYSAEEIQQVFDALRAVGIDTVEELASATDQTLIAALAQLEAVEFPFAEAAEDAQELIDKVNNLPDEIRTRIVFDVQTNVSDSDREVLSKSREASGIVGNSQAGLGA